MIDVSLAKVKNAAPIDTERKLEDELASFCFVVELIRFKTNVRYFLSAREINCIFETKSFSDYTLLSKAVLSALLSAADADAFSIP